MRSAMDKLKLLTPEQRALLALKAKQQKVRADDGGPIIVKQPRQAGVNSFPLSYSQQRVMFYEEFMQGTHRYNFANGYRMKGKLNVDALRKVLNEMVRRHEVMRSYITYENDAYVQHIRTEMPIDLCVIPLDDERQLYARMEKDARVPYDFMHGPLVKANLFQLAPDEHVLVWMTHHLIYDGWSATIFEDELNSLYRSFALNEPIALPDLDIQYPDFAVWQAEWMKGSQFQSQLDFWKKKLAAPLTMLNMPTDFPRPSVYTENGVKVASLTLDAPFAQSVRDTGKQLGCTSFIMLLAAYNLLLASYNGQKEIIIGTPMANRGMEALEKIVGFFANTLPIRSAIDMHGSFRDFAIQLRGTILEANDNQDIPFDRLVEALNPERSVSHSLFFDTMFLHERHGQGDMNLPELEVEPVAGDRTRGGSIDLTMTVFELRGGRLEVTITYSTDLFKESTITRMLDHYQAILARAVQSTERPLYEITAVPEEQLKVIAGWNASATEHPPIMLQHLYVERQAILTPHVTAVCSEGRSISYEQLNGRANQLAHELRSRGVLPNRTVGLYMERSVDMIIGLLGILKAGGAYVPLDSKLPEGRLRTIIEEADVTIVVSESVLYNEQIMDSLKDEEVVLLDRDWQHIERHELHNPPMTSVPSDLMYVLFTSGSTGKPKGIAVEHRSYANYLQGMLQRMDLQECGHYALVSTLAADLGTPMIWAAFAMGGTLHVIPYERTADPDAFSAYCKEHPIDVMKIVPSHFETLLNVQDSASIVPRRCLIFAGEASHWGTVDEVRRLNPDCAIQNHYGPTETTVSVLSYPVPSSEQSDRMATLPLGTPIPNVPVYVLNEFMQPVPIGATGELYIGGRSVSRGYYGRPDLTAERFVPDPFSTEPDGRLYRTGDLVRYRPDGTIHFIGRTDYQVKLRGYRIETGEIEHALLQVDGVRDNVVIIREDIPGDKRLVAYLVPEIKSDHERMNEDGLILNMNDIRKFIKSILPEYMIPSSFVELERLPLNTNGKLDRAALLAPGVVDRTGDSDFVAPTTPIELSIAAVWSEVLGLEQVGIDHEFFDLGGDSFKAVKVVRKMNNAFSVMDLFQYPTVRELAIHLQSGATGSGDLLNEFKKASTIGGKIRSLVCIPYGGGSAITFQPLSKTLPDNYALYAVQLPGHDYSNPDQPLESIDEVAAKCAAEIKKKIKGDLYLYGHCLGGAVVLRIALLLEQQHVPVKGIFMAGTFPWARLPFRLTEWWNRLFPRHKWTSDKFARDMLRAFGGFDDEISPDEQKFVLRNMRHDAKEAEDFYTELYSLEHRPQLNVPIACFVGGADRMTEFYEERYREWGDFSDDVRLHVVEHAGHYFHKHQSEYLGSSIAQHIKAWEEDQHTLQEVAATVQNPIREGQLHEQSLVEQEVKPSVRSFLLVTLCLIISTIGTSLTGFALGIWVFQETGSISDYATISLFAIMPTLLLLPVAGAVVDRYDRRKVILGGQCLALCSVIFLAVLLYTNNLEIWAIYVAAAIGSVAGAFIMPAYQAATAQLVPKRYLGNANGLGQIIMSLNGIMAPALGGALVVLIGLNKIIIIDLLLLTGSILTLSLLRFPNLMFKKREETMIKEIVGGWSYIINRKSLVAMVVFFIVVNFFMSLYNVLTAPFLLQFMNADKVGLVIAIEGAGLLIGSVIMTIWGGFDKRADGMVGFVILTGLSIAVAGIYPTFLTAAIGLFGFGLALAFINTHWLALIQTKVGLELQGRVLATNQVLAFSMRPLSFLLAGPLVASVFGPLALMLPDNSLAPNLFGIGDGRGIGLLLATSGVLLFIWGLIGMKYRPLRHMESILPDAVPGSVIVKDKDKLQQLANSQLNVGA
jgi:amino acid adenylation domain-containing protein